MATNTPNYNLVKPEMSDYADIRVLNGNMDIIDAQLKKASDIDLSNYATKPELEKYMPVTGGNFTGDITVKNNPVTYVIEDMEDTSNASYDLRAIKYNDGMLKNIMTCKTNIGVTTVNFLVPFIDIDSVQVMSGRIAIGENNTQQENMYSVAHLTKTSFQTANGANASRQQTMLIGRWK